MARDQSAPAAEGLGPGHFPTSPVEAGHVEPNPRRVRAILDGVIVIDTIKAMYVWDQPYYPRLSIPQADVQVDALPDRTARPDRRVEGHLRVPWDAVDSWWEEDEEVYGHPRSPFVRVDALRSTRHVRVELDGQVLAESASPVAVVETGLPTRWYLDPSAVRWELLPESDTQTLCPYKGRTTGYWSAQVGDHHVDDVAWSYAYPTRQLTPIAGLVAFLDESVRVIVDGVPTRD